MKHFKQMEVATSSDNYSARYWLQPLTNQMFLDLDWE